MAIITIKNILVFKAAVKTNCFAKNPIKGGIPANENNVKDKLIVNVGFMLKYPFNWDISCTGE